MNENWRYTTKSITKFNPFFRDKNGTFTKNDWIGFFQIGQQFEDGELTLDSYLKEESKYIKASIYFFKFHMSNRIIINNLEKNGIDSYLYNDREELLQVYRTLKEGMQISIDQLGIVVKLILRDLIWAELFDISSNKIALRFGRDFYMYFNSDRNLDDLFKEIKEIGLYVD